MRTISERNATVGILVLRFFLGQFWFLQMIGKARDQESGITSLHNLSIWAKNTSEWMAKMTPMPMWMLRPYTTVLPYVECAIGLLLLAGLQTRRTLILSALVLVSLDVGLMFQLKHDVVAMNTIILITTLFAIQLEPHNRFAADSLFSRSR